MSKEEYIKKKKFLLGKLSESIQGLEKIKELIENGKAIENEDWVDAATPFRDFAMNFHAVNDYVREHESEN